MSSMMQLHYKHAIKIRQYKISVLYILRPDLENFTANLCNKLRMAQEKYYVIIILEFYLLVFVVANVCHFCRLALKHKTLYSQTLPNIRNCQPCTIFAYKSQTLVYVKCASSTNRKIKYIYIYTCKQLSP